ncbi:hypothetical protein [Paraglaciecola sp.]|uniref:hypothetical protein n=1 Tax=Paraglaciecola sp. TaxID=1920173 RepID=UPI0030F376A4
MKIRNYEKPDLGAVLSSWETATRLAHPFMTDEFIAQERINVAEVYMPNTDTWVVDYLCIAYYGQNELGTLRLKNTTDIAFSELKYFDAIAIISRLKYPEPSKKSNQWLTKFERRNKHLALRVNTANKLINKDKK